MIKVKSIKVIDVGDWDDLVEKTYGRTYSFQQQDGCKERQRWRITVPVKNPEDFENDTIPGNNVTSKTYNKDQHQDIN